MVWSPVLLYGWNQYADTTGYTNAGSEIQPVDIRQFLMMTIISASVHTFRRRNNNFASLNVTSQTCFPCPLTTNQRTTLACVPFARSKCIPTYQRSYSSDTGKYTCQWNNAPSYPIKIYSLSTDSNARARIICLIRNVTFPNWIFVRPIVNNIILWTEISERTI